jgi:putative hydrolase of the HAD superfamily
MILEVLVMGMSNLGSFILMITFFVIPSFVAICALIFLIIITKKFRRQGAVADKKWLAGTIVCAIIAAISFIMNIGWIRVFLLWSGVPWIHISAFLFVGILTSYKIRYSKAIKITSILSCLTCLFANFLLPDGGDEGSYMFFGIIRNDFLVTIGGVISTTLFCANIALLIVNIILVAKCKIVNVQDDSISTCEQKEKTIKNIVFDFGNTLISFEPSYIVSKTVSDPDDAKLLCEVVFDRIYFDRLDEGTITDEEVFADYKNRLPERLWDTAEVVYRSWIYNIPEIEGMRELIVYLKEKYNVSVFLLSNISQYFVDHASEIPMLELMDKCVFSCVCGKVKPDSAIFEQLCRECEITPEETVFIDDLESNIEGARRAGICGYRFDGDANKLRAYLDSIL